MISAQAGITTATAWGWVAPGAAGASGLVLTPALLHFHDQLQGTSSTLPVTLMNESDAPVAITGVTTTTMPLAGNLPFASVFSQSNNCPASLAVGSSCIIKVTFTPPSFTLTLSDLIQGSVQIQEAGGATQQVALQAQAHEGASDFWLSPPTFDLGSVALGGSASLTGELYNGTAAALSLTGIVLIASPGYTQTNTCGSSLAPGARCAITVTFSPSAPQGISSGMSVAFDLAGCNSK